VIELFGEYPSLVVYLGGFFCRTYPVIQEKGKINKKGRIMRINSEYALKAS
jgi:hypothetical protein